jgi:hypothetical protein
MIHNKVSGNLFVWVTLAAVIVLFAYPGINTADSQSMSATNNASAAWQHVDYT